MNKQILFQEYENNGLTIVDFHLGLRLAKPMFINTIMTIFIIISYALFLYALYEISIVENPNTKVSFGLFAIAIVLISKYIAKVVAYAIVFLCFLLFLVITFNLDHNHSLDFILSNSIALSILFTLLITAVISTLVTYRVNRNILIKDGILSIPASDVEQSILAYIILKPFWGLFYRRKILITEIISVKNDGYGSKKLGIYPITITDINASNRLIFTSRQKRDEFRSKISILLGLRDTDSSSFGES